jgi:hypothetical protein
MVASIYLSERSSGMKALMVEAVVIPDGQTTAS